MTKKEGGFTSANLSLEFHSFIQRQSGVLKQFHKNYECITPLEGKCVCTVNEHRYELSVGDCIILFPFQVLELELEPNASVQRIIFNDHLILTVTQSIEGMIPKNPVFRPNESVLDFGLKMIFDTFGEDSGPISRITPFENRMRIKGLLYMLAGDFLASTTLITAPKTDIAAMDIALYIAENFKNNISLKDIAKEKGYNYQYLSRTFNRYMNMNFKKMLNFYRIHQAFAMLQDTDLPISRIAFECGFKSIRSFNQVCHDVFNKKPTEIRSMRRI